MCLPVRVSQEEGDYARALRVCVRCGQALGSLAGLRCAAAVSSPTQTLSSQLCKYSHGDYAEDFRTDGKCRAAQEEGDYAHALWLCVRCGQALGSLGGLRAAAPLAGAVNVLYEDTIDRLEAALQACCADFKPDTLCKVAP